MFKKKYRLAPHIRFTNSSVYHTSFFTLKVAKNDQAHNRYGFIVTKRIDKRAVIRNQTKRKVRFCVEKLFTETKPGYDMLFLIKKDATSTDQKLIHETIYELFKKRNLLL